MKKIISMTSYVFAILFLIVYIFSEIRNNITLSEFGRLFLLCTSCTFLFIGGILWSKYKQNNKAMKINLWLFFILYLVLLITLTLFDPMWGRQGFNAFNWTKEGLHYYLSNRLNIIPFATIINYIKEFNSLYSTSSIVFNLFGNFVALMPMAFFLPLLFKKQNKFKTFLLTIIFIVVGIELVQFITFSGSCDIDDLILNTSGALLLYGIIKIKSVNNLIRNIFLLEKNKIAKKEAMKILIIILIILILSVLLIKFRANLYNNNLQEHNSRYNFDVEILDESETCDAGLEQFYEDEHYVYYFDCLKSDKVYAVINGKDKYLVKDLLNNNPTDYYITIHTFEDVNLDFGKKSKYEEINISGIGNVTANIEIRDKNILKIDNGDSILESDATNPSKDRYKMQFFIIPLTTGSTEIEIKLIDNESGKLNSSKKYKVNVKEDLSVYYEEIL